MKLKRFLVAIRNSFRRIFYTKEFTKEDNLRLARDLSAIIMDLDIEYRFDVLSKVINSTIGETQQQAINHKKAQMLILSKLDDLYGDLQNKQIKRA